MKQVTRSIIALLEGNSFAPPDRYLTVSWDGQSAADVRLPEELEKFHFDIRREYLEWIYEMGRKKFSGRPLLEQMQLVTDFSFWWTTRLAEKQILKTPSISEVFKLRAFELLLQNWDQKEIHYFGHSTALHLCLEEYCRKKSLRYEWKGKRSKKARLSLRRLTAFLYLANKSFRWLRARRKIGSLNPSNLIITYFPNIDLEEASRGRFRSFFWGPLSETFEKKNALWIWIYSKSPQLSYSGAISLRNRLSGHFLLEEFLGLKGILRCLYQFFRLGWRAPKFRRLAPHCVLSGSQMTFWPLIKDDWEDSVRGKAAMEAVFYDSAFKNLCRFMPPSVRLIYLWENQPWELCLLAYWKAKNLGFSLGVQHSTVCPMDLRQLEDPHEYRDGLKPMPSRLAVNGRGAHNVLVKAGYPRHRIEVVEALRYVALKETSPRRHPLAPSDRVLLVLTGYDYEETRFQLKLLKEAGEHGGLLRYRKVLIKPHPFGKDLSRLFGTYFLTELEVEIVENPLEKLFPKVDVVYLSSLTSASVEVAWHHIPAIHAGPSKTINLNPLVGEGLRFVYTSTDLIRELETPKPLDLESDFLQLDSNLLRWNHLLETRNGKSPDLDSE